MWRAVFRVTCVLLLGTILLDVTNSKCFNKSLTYKYSKEITSFPVKNTILTSFGELKGTYKNFKLWAEQGFPQCCEDVCASWKRFTQKVTQYAAITIQYANLLIEHTRKFISKDSHKKQAVTLNYSPTNEKVIITEE